MNRLGILILGAALAASFCYGQDATSAPQAPAASSHGAFPVKLSKTLDSSKLKDGDAVEVETAGGFKLADGTTVPKGSKLSGHVTASKARSKGDSDSQLTLSFDKLNVANGKTLSIKGMVQAVFPPQEESAPLMAGAANGAAGGGMTGATVGTVNNNKTGTSTDAPVTASSPTNPQSVGVQGIHDLELNDGVLTSKGKNVKLNNGVRIIVHVDILG